MTDRPITFRAPMVRALLAGRKSMTRRVLKTQPPEWVTRMTHEGRCGWIGSGDGHGTLMHVPCAVGDRLWVRESFITGFDTDDEFGRPVGDLKVWYRATDRGLTWYDPDTESTLDNPPWKSSTQMPRWASRLTLTVTDVRIQRVQDISEADARAEGATSRPECHGFCLRNFGWSMDWSRVGTLSRWASVPPGSPRMNPLKESDISLGDPRMAFASYWNDLHGPDAWDANPWVTALTFTVHRQNIDQMEPTND